MKKLVYRGNAPGQANEVTINGETYKRGESYTVTNKTAAILKAKGGFIAESLIPKEVAVDTAATDKE